MAPHVSYPLQDVPGIDISPVVRDLIDRGPVHPVDTAGGRIGWLVTGHDAVQEVLRDPQFSRAAMTGDAADPLGGAFEGPGAIVSLDPPDHTRVRKVIAASFTPRTITRLRPGVEVIAEQLVTAMIASGSPGDLVAGVGVPLPLMVICELLGVPYEDRATFSRWADSIMAISSISPDEASANKQSLLGYLHDLVRARRNEAQHDLVSLLAHTPTGDGTPLDGLEIANLCIGILVGGYDTTANEICNMVFLLCTNPHLMAHARTGSTGLNETIDEMMRWIALSINVGFPRKATRDTVLGGQPIAAGDVVFPDVIAANRDASVFADPHSLVPGRENQRRTLLFGSGPHFCPGAHLARTEIEVALSTLLRRLPGLRLAVAPEEVPWRWGQLVRGPRELLISW
ncbi:cytochrome P450 [Lentzea sp. HUAS12]|uniref:cytochrome P450 n=1 Tax=Lentzea sp. HUAS12 TaxID=2951806 RepID=UPI00209E751A|nr:cytochrome P450 [Lentzea sp. HUAS12]USX56347.1 cytochrome P450 [Lentzea sp. HUAS12]